MFEENGNRNGRSSPMNEHEMTDMSLNGNHGNDIPRDGGCLFTNLRDTAYIRKSSCMPPIVTKCCVSDII